jgi:hypothetical protein
MFPRKPRTVTKAFALTVVCALLLSGLIPLHASHAAAQPKIRWSEKKLDATVAPGGGSVRQVTFTSDQNLQDVSVETTPSLAGLVSVRPTQIASAFADQPQTVTLFISAPADATPGVRGGTIHVRSGSRTLPLPLNVSVEVKQGVVDVDLPVPQPISPADVTLVGTSETAFNPQSTTLRFAVSGATLDTNPAGVEVIVNGASAPATSLQITNSSVAVPVFLAEGRNDVSLFAWDTQGSLVAKTATLWAGSYTMSVAIHDENGQPSTGALVTARLGDDKEVKATATSSAGSVFFSNCPTGLSSSKPPRATTASPRSRPTAARASRNCACAASTPRAPSTTTTSASGRPVGRPALPRSSSSRTTRVRSCRSKTLRRPHPSPPRRLRA